jgi:hypothetical protein
MARKPASKTESAILNNKTYMQYYNRLTELAISMFEWKNIPDTIDARFLELSLYSDGMAVFFKDEDLGELALQVMISGDLDVYRVPIKREAFATNGYHRMLDNTDSVIIFNNYLRTNSMLDVEMYARRLYEIERTIDVNVKQQKTPKLILCSENQRLVMKNLYMQYDGNEPYIFGDKALDMNGVKVFDTNAPYVGDKLNQLKREIFNEALTYLGISNVNIQKKERLLSDEVTRNMGSVEAQKYTRLNARKDACKKINKMFGLEIDVEYREDVKMLADEYADELGGEDNE